MSESLFSLVRACVRTYVRACARVCVCVCERERERERESVCVCQCPAILKHSLFLGMCLILGELFAMFADSIKVVEQTDGMQYVLSLPCKPLTPH